MDHAAFQVLARPLRRRLATPRSGRHRRPVQPRRPVRLRPVQEAVVGRAAVVAAWLADPDEPGSWEADYEVLAIDGDACVAHGRTRYLTDDRAAVDREFANVFVCRFDDDGRCREFTEWYMRTAAGGPPGLSELNRAST